MFCVWKSKPTAAVVRMHRALVWSRQLARNFMHRKRRSVCSKIAATLCKSNYSQDKRNGWKHPNTFAISYATPHALKKVNWLLDGVCKLRSAEGILDRDSWSGSNWDAPGINLRWWQYALARVVGGLLLLHLLIVCLRALQRTTETFYETDLDQILPH